MSEDRLLRDLALLVKEHDSEIARFEVACARSLTQASPSLEPEILRPLGADFRAATFARLAQELGAATGGAAPQSRHEDREAVAATSVGAWLARLFAPVRTLSSRPLLPLGAAAAVLVAIALVIGVSREGTLGTGRFPQYQLSLQGKAYFRGEQTVGGGPVTFATGDAFQLLLRPETASSGAVDVRALLQVGETIEPLVAPTAQVLDNGVVRIEGAVGSDVHLPAGDTRLLVVVGRPKYLPGNDELVHRLRGLETVQTADWEAWKLEVRLQP